MSLGRNSKMRDAFKKLEVNRPLKLPKEGPGLAPPSEPSRKEVPLDEAPPIYDTEQEVPQGKVPQNALSQSELPRIEVAQEQSGKDSSQNPTVSSGSDFRNEVPANEVPRSGSVMELSQKEMPHADASRIELPSNGATEAEPAQFEIPQLDFPRIESAMLPQYEVAQLEAGSEVGTSSGYFFRLSPAAFSEPSLRRLTGDCFRLFIWLSSRAWRFPDSTGVIRASVSFIEQETGMGHATISRGLKSLKDFDLVSLVETDFKKGNIWRISPVAYSGKTPGPGTGSRRPRSEEPQSEAPRRVDEGTSKRGSSSLISSRKHPQNEQHLKNYKNFKNLSQEAALPLVQRIETMNAPRKQETELQHLDALLERFSAESLLKALTFLESKGTLKGEKCHSPFTYLSFAIDEVMARCKSPVPPKFSTPSMPEERGPDPEASKKALEVFESSLPPREQEEFVSAFVSREFPHGFLPPSRVVRVMAAAAWASSSIKPQSHLQLVG